MNEILSETEQETLDLITEKIIGAAIEVHTILGPGLLESAYETCLHYELNKMGMNVEHQKAIPIAYKDIKLGHGFRLDLIVENKVIVEIKAVEKVASIHQVQLYSYLKLTGCKVGLIINFNVDKVSKGISRVVNGYSF